VLYIVGKDMTYPPQDMRRILNEDWILWEESMQESELPLYFSALDAFAYLSEYEGFGLPPLEALSCGTVPILLKRSALAEVYSEFSLMAENADAGEIRSHLRSALEDLDRMDVLLRAFKKKRAYFSWDRVAGEFGDAMNEVLCGK
jgi:glycosyltransferase involved in cell wall biosynthesis